METFSSAEELVIKTRKPYTITKQRERWTEEEHNGFLEALKLYGRAWQRIEEHIGTKTAVQIRSHAQKFFSKLEKEAVAKGVPIGQALDIEIPPPRPKRKPSNPYPRKTVVVPTASQVEAKDRKLLTSVSFPHCKQGDVEKEPLPEKPNGEEKQTDVKENQDDNRSVVISLFQEDHCSSESSAKSNSTTKTEVLINLCCFREFVPSLKEGVKQDATNESYVTTEDNGNQNLDKPDVEQVQDNGTSKSSEAENSCPLHDKLGKAKKLDDFMGALPTYHMQSMQNYPPVHILGGNLDPCMQAPSSDRSFQDYMYHPVEVHTHSDLYLHAAASATTEHQSKAPRSDSHPSFPTFHPPFTPTHHNQDGYSSFLQLSTFSSLILSTLLQSPVTNAAASLAATLWPYANAETSADSPECAQGGFASGQTDSTSNMAAIAAATVSAATAWWAAHGLIPLCAPLNALTCPPPSETIVAFEDTDQIPPVNTGREEVFPGSTLRYQELGLEHSEALRAQNSTSKSSTVSSSDSEESGGPKQSTGPKATDHDMAAAGPEVHDPSKTKRRKQVYHSSCGSNTPSCEVETDALEKHEKAKEDLKEADPNHLASGSSRRCSRSGSNVNDSWKVSGEGRLAFQALFSRELLPQSFSIPHEKIEVHQKDDIEEDEQNPDEEVTDLSLVDLNLNSKTWGSYSARQGDDKNALPRCENNGEEGLLTIGLGHGKFNSCRTGFKPYKRCSMEAKENRVVVTASQDEEEGPKKMRLEGEALS